MSVFADTSTYTLAYAEETTFDAAISGSGVFTFLRNTGESLNTTIESARSDEIDADRQFTGSVHVSGTSGGSVNFQLSYGEYDPFLEAALQSPDWTTAVSTTGTSVASQVILGVASTANITIGSSVRLTGLPTASEDGVYTVKSFVTDTSITVVETVSDGTSSITIEADGYVWNASNGRSFTMEKNFAVSGVNNYFLMSGMRVGSMSLSMSTGSILSGEFAFQGATGVANGTSSQDSGTIAAAGTNELMNSVSDVTGLTLDAVSTSGVLTNIPTSFQELSLSINNNLREQTAVGSLFPAGIGSGRINVEATATVYFANQTFFNQFIANDSVQLRFKVSDSAGNVYAFVLPELKISAHEVTASGADADVMASVTFSGVKDARFGTEKSIIITRIHA